MADGRVMMRGAPAATQSQPHYAASTHQARMRYSTSAHMHFSRTPEKFSFTDLLRVETYGRTMRQSILNQSHEASQMREGGQVTCFGTQACKLAVSSFEPSHLGLHLRPKNLLDVLKLRGTV